MRKKIILVGLNELNFELIEKYTQKGYLPNFKSLFQTYGYKQTSSESDYELLEPWIQWVSIHTGKMYAEHHVFRLGDIAERTDLKQLWEIAEEKGLTVGAISPFNARNNLKKPLFFVPDPWTQTHPSGNSTLIKVSKAISDAVNNNANSQLGFNSAMALLKGFLMFVPIKKYFSYVKMVVFNLRRKATRALILDTLLSDTFISLWKKNRPDFSSIFLNGGAHIQHHYMFNSKVYDGDQKNPEWYCPSNEDPLLDILTQYDQIIKEVMQLNCRVFFATGLHQNPHTENTFYWRLKDHRAFLEMISAKGIKSVVPRMSRDFLIVCADSVAADSIQLKLEDIRAASDGERIFSVDNRGDSLFVELIYPNEIKTDFRIKIGDELSELDLSKYVSFVAIKNGEHHNIGYFIDTGKKSLVTEKIKVKEIFTEIVASFS